MSESVNNSFDKRTLSQVEVPSEVFHGDKKEDEFPQDDHEGSFEVVWEEFPQDSSTPLSEVITTISGKATANVDRLPPKPTRVVSAAAGSAESLPETSTVSATVGSNCITEKQLRRVMDETVSEPLPPKQPRVESSASESKGANRPIDEGIGDGSTGSQRFGVLQTGKELEDRIKRRIPKSTRSSSSWAVSIFRDWRIWRNWHPATREDTNWPIPGLGHQDYYLLDYWLAQFITEVCKKDGSPYPPGSLTSIGAGLQRHIRDELGKRDVWLLKKDDIYFKTFRDALDARRKELIATGMGTHPKRADVITEQDERQLWDSGVINVNTAKGLSYGTYFYNCKIFGFRARDEHGNLEVTQYSLDLDQENREYLTYHGRLAKAVTGANDCKALPRLVRHYSNPHNPRCIVNLFKKYLDEVPTEGRFYRRPLANIEGKISFSLQPVGIHTLDKYMYKMCTEAGINMEGRHITGHSGKATLCTRLYEKGIDEQAIAVRSGHRSSAIRNYKRESVDMQQHVSNLLQPPLPSVPVEDVSAEVPAQSTMCPEAPKQKQQNEEVATFDLGLDLLDTRIEEQTQKREERVQPSNESSVNSKTSTSEAEAQKQGETLCITLPDHIKILIVKHNNATFKMEFS